MEAAHLNDTLRALRQAADIPGERVAEVLGLTLPTLTARERGERHLFPGEVRRLLDGLRNIDRLRARRTLARLDALGGKSATGADLRAVRRMAGLSYEQMAAALGLNPETLRCRELAEDPWGWEPTHAYLHALRILVVQRTLKLNDGLEALRQRLDGERRPVPPRVRRAARVDKEALAA